jgi:hypothetical protein
VERDALNNVRSNLRIVRAALDDMGYRYGMVEQSGGEPTHHPQVVEAVGEVFNDCVHKIITNGIPSRSILEYVRRRGENAFVVLSLDHHTLELNRLRLGTAHAMQPDRTAQIHQSILETLDLFTRNNIPTVLSTIISTWNIAGYLSFIAWLEEHYPRQVEEGTLVPIPVSLVSFGNPRLGQLNPSQEQLAAFEEAIEASSLLTVERTRGWLLRQLVGHYYHKRRFFEFGESIDQICLHPSRHPCDIFRYMISFNFQDEEVLRPPTEALFEGYLCGVKVLGNIGYALTDMGPRLPVLGSRPSNMGKGKKYYRVDQIAEYIEKKEAASNDRELVNVGGSLGYFGDLRRGMCTLDDFDGVWWPFNAYLKGFADEATIAEFWSLFRNATFLDKLRHLREQERSRMDCHISPELADGRWEQAGPRHSAQATRQTSFPRCGQTTSTG